MSRQVVITGLGPISGAGLGIEANWEAIREGRSAIGPVEAFDASGFDCRIAAEVKGFKVRDVVPKSYRKATKVMARDIELAVAAADYAARDAGLKTPGTHPDAEPSYASARIGCHIGSGLISADINEFTGALIEAKVPGGTGPGDFDLHTWGREGMNALTPLWLLKYLPNMLACHVSIIHASHGPSNTITCAEASSGLSVGESLRVIQRGKADACFCGGAESKVNLTAFAGQETIGRLVSGDDPAAVRPFDEQATGMVIGEGGGIVILEALETAQARSAGKVYARVLGFGATQTVHRPSKNRTPDEGGTSIAAAIRAALREAGIEPDAIDLVVPYGSGLPDYDRAEAAALRDVFGDRLAEVPVLNLKARVGNCGAGAGAIDLVIAAKALHEQTIPAIPNRDQPLPGFAPGTDAPRPADLRHALVYSTGLGGQNTAMVIGKV